MGWDEASAAPIQPSWGEAKATLSAVGVIRAKIKVEIGRSAAGVVELRDLAESVNSGTNPGDLTEKVNSGISPGDLAERVNSGTNPGDLAEKVNLATNPGDLAEKLHIYFGIIFIQYYYMYIFCYFPCVSVPSAQVFIQCGDAFNALGGFWGDTLFYLGKLKRHPWVL
ncbi:hypothetical protein GW17_00027994 [Ensete ventricosum]|nr:hypothetical protein GW17_00027994 [Ensete ventricosum]